MPSQALRQPLCLQLANSCRVAGCNDTAAGCPPAWLSNGCHCITHLTLLQASEEEEARLKREAQGRAALQAATRKAQLEAERDAAMGVAKKAEQEARARAAQERLAALQGKWADDAAIIQVGPCACRQVVLLSRQVALAWHDD